VATSTRPVVVYPDNSLFRRRIAVLAPVLAIANVLLACRLATGIRASPGAGWWALPTVAAAFLVPVIWVVGLLGLRRLNARIVLEDGVLYVRNSLRRWTVVIDTDDITGLHPVDVQVSSDQTRPDRIVLACRDHRPLVIDTRIWQPDQIRLLGNRLGAPVSPKRTVSWKELRRSYPGVRMPWLQVHPGTVIALGSLGMLAYVVVVVEVAFAL
jgi:hypothetical protein